MQIPLWIRNEYFIFLKTLHDYGTNIAGDAFNAPDILTPKTQIEIQRRFPEVFKQSIGFGLLYDLGMLQSGFNQNFFHQCHVRAIGHTHRDVLRYFTSGLCLIVDFFSDEL